MANKAYKTITAENQFTDEVRVPSDGTLTIIDTDSGSMTITLQYKPWSPTDDADWQDLESKTDAGRYEFSGGGDAWRAGCKTGDFTSGEFALVLVGS